MTSGDLGSVSWSGDGTRLYAAGKFWMSGEYPIRVWDRAGQGTYRDIKGARTTVTHILPCGQTMAIGSAGPAFGLIAANATLQLWQESVKADLRSKLAEHFTVSRDGRRVRFGLKPFSVDPVVFDLDTERVSDAPQPIPDLHVPDITGAPVTDWKDSRAPKFNGNPLGFKPMRRRARWPSRRIRAFSSWVPSGRCGLRQGRQATLGQADPRHRLGRQHSARRQGACSPPTATAPSAGIVSVTAQELLALFVHAKDRRWVAWTPKGYYTASTGGEEMIGWHVNRGWNEAADYFPAAQFRDQFNRPDIVQRVLATLDEDDGHQ